MCTNVYYVTMLQTMYLVIWQHTMYLSRFMLLNQ